VEMGNETKVSALKKREKFYYESRDGYRKCPHCKYTRLVYEGKDEEFKKKMDAKENATKTIKKEKCTNCGDHFCASPECKHNENIKWKYFDETGEEKRHMCGSVNHYDLLTKINLRQGCIESNANKCPKCKAKVERDKSDTTNNGGMIMGGCSYVTCRTCEEGLLGFCIYCGTRTPSGQSHVHANIPNNGCCEPTFMALNWEGVNEKIVDKSNFPEYEYTDDDMQTRIRLVRDGNTYHPTKVGANDNRPGSMTVQEYEEQLINKMWSKDYKGQKALEWNSYEKRYDMGMYCPQEWKYVPDGLWMMLGAHLEADSRREDQEGFGAEKRKGKTLFK